MAPISLTMALKNKGGHPSIKEQKGPIHLINYGPMNASLTTCMALPNEGSYYGLKKLDLFS